MSTPDSPTPLASSTEAPLPSRWGLIGQSPALDRLAHDLGWLAPIRMPILLVHERGIEPEAVARAIHDASPRRAAPFVSARGTDVAFTWCPRTLHGHPCHCGANHPDPLAGLFARARRGTLFIRGIDDLPRIEQARIAHLLDRSPGPWPRPLTPLPAGTRLIAATHRDLRAAVAQGEFWADLADALMAWVRLPPLRERLEDLPLLVEQIRREFNAEFGIAIAGVTWPALQALAASSWPGNMSGLARVLRGSMLRKRQGWLGPEDLDWSSEPRPTDPAPGAVVHGPVASSPTSGPAGRSQAERPRLPEQARQLVALHGVVTRGHLARTAGISGEHARRTLVALVREGVLERTGAGRSTRYVPATPREDAPDRNGRAHDELPSPSPIGGTP
jgi:DNA-binding NtrC family response regulator